MSLTAPDVVQKEFSIRLGGQFVWSTYLSLSLYIRSTFTFYSLPFILGIKWLYLLKCSPLARIFTRSVFSDFRVKIFWGGYGYPVLIKYLVFS